MEQLFGRQSRLSNVFFPFSISYLVLSSFLVNFSSLILFFSILVMIFWFLEVLKLVLR